MNKQETIDRLVVQAGVEQLSQRLRTIVESAYDNGVLAGRQDVSRETSERAVPGAPEPNQRLETFAVLAGGFYIGSRFTREDAEKWAKELFEERPSWPPEIRRMVEIGDDEQIVDHAQTAFDDALWKVLTEAQWEIAKLRARESRSHWIKAMVKRDDYGAYCIPLPSGIFDGKVPYQWQAGQTVLIQRKDP